MAPNGAKLLGRRLRRIRRPNLPKFSKRLYNNIVSCVGGGVVNRNRL